MDRAQIISGIGHLVLILWLLVGDWFWRPAEPPPIEAVTVSMLSESAFQAMQDAAPKAPEPAAVPAVKPETRPEVAEPAPDEPAPEEPAPVEPAPQAAPEPEPATQPPAPEAPAEAPVSPDPQPEPTPPTGAPVSEAPQPIAQPTADKRPKPRPVERVAAVPVEDRNDTPEVADEVVPEVTDQPQPAHARSSPDPTPAGVVPPLGACPGRILLIAPQRVPLVPAAAAGAGAEAREEEPRPRPGPAPPPR